MSGQKGDGGIGVAMRERDPRVSEPADARGDPRNDTKRDARGGKCHRFLAAASKDARVAALEPQHPLALAGEADQPRRDVRLAGRGTTAALAGIIERCARGRQMQDPRVDKGVVNHGVGAGESVQRQRREQPRITRTGPHEPDVAGFEIRQTERCAVDQVHRTDHSASGLR